MQKIYTLLLTTFFLHTSVSFSFAYLKADSIGVENYKGKKVILYKVDPKETYYSIARKYNVAYNEVMEFNDSKLLQPGVILKIPTSQPFSGNTTPAVTPSTATAESSYTVKAKDNLNLIAGKFGVTVDQIKQENGLTSNNLQIGQVLKIPGGNNDEAIPNTSASRSPSSAAKPVAQEETPIVRYYTAKITHKVKSGETLGGIAEKYDTTVEALKKLNKLSSTKLKIGQAIKVQVKRKEIIRQRITPEHQPEVETSVKSNTSSSSDIEHIVVAGESIYSIAKKYGLTTYQIKTANNLNDNDLAVGQKLLIKGADHLASQATTDAGTEESESETMRDPKLKQPASKFGLTRFDEKGTAVWIADPDLDATKMLVLHRTAPVGTIIRIMNPLTNRSTFAKVVGKFTENETTKDVIIVITKAVADAVGALDKRFFCNINYGAVENEQQ
ncbi:stage VI sporulation protein D [compost metagenome]